MMMGSHSVPVGIPVLLNPPPDFVHYNRQVVITIERESALVNGTHVDPSILPKTISDIMQTREQRLVFIAATGDVGWQDYVRTLDEIARMNPGIRFVVVRTPASAGLVI